MADRPVRLLIAAAAVAVVATPVAVLATRSPDRAPAALAPAAPPAPREPAPWWCEPGAKLVTSRLPDTLPHSACSLEGRTIVDDKGAGVVVPASGFGVADAHGPQVWTDEYAVHVGGSPLHAAPSYADAIERYATTGAGDRTDVERMATALRRLTRETVARARPAESYAALLDAADTLVAATATPPAAAPDVLAAGRLVRAYLAQALVKDDSPDRAEAAAVPGRVLAALRSGTVDAATADRALVDAALTWALADDESLAAHRTELDALVADLRAAIARGGAAVDLSGVDADRYEPALRAVADHYAG
jgi:hypothetical protein